MDIHQFIRLVNRITVSTCKVILIIMMFIIVGNAMGRYLFNSPIPGSFAITEEYLMVGLIFLSIGYVQSIDGNVTVRVIAETKLSMRTRRYIKIVFYILTAVIFAYIAYLTGGVAYDRLMSGARLAGIIRLPTAPSWAAVAFGCAYFVFIVLMQIQHELRLLLGSEREEFEEYFYLDETEEQEDLTLRGE